MWALVARVEIILTLSCCAYGIVKGGSADRLGAAFILASYIADDVAFALTRPHFPVMAIFFGDFLLALALLFVAVRYSNLWLGCAMLLQSVDLCSQGLAFTGEGLSNLQQFWLNNIVSMLMLLCVMTGATISWRKRRLGRQAAAAPWSYAHAGGAPV
jgi:uncharacterized membrane protein AbrB (regulator of aidB expression)